MKELNKTELMERWKRFNNPKTPEDYGLSFTVKELKKIPEGRQIINACKELKNENRD